MKKIVLSVMCSILLMSAVAFAGQAGEKEAVMKLLEISNARKMSDQIMTSMDTIMEQQFQAASEHVSLKGQEALKTIRKDSVKWMQDNFSWDQMQDMYVEIYTEVFTEDEINQLVAFYQSPLGKTMLEKMPELLRVTFEKSQALVQDKIPLFQENLKKNLEALEAKYSKNIKNHAGTESLKN